MNRIGWLAILGVIGIGSIGRGDDWPQWMGMSRDAICAERISKFPPAGRRSCSAGVGGYAGPAVANGRVYVPIPRRERTRFRQDQQSRDGTAAEGQGTYLVLRREDRRRDLEAYRVRLRLRSRIAGPRCTPTVDNGQVFAAGTMGNLVCLDAEKGTSIWSKDFKKDYSAKVPVWGFCSHRWLTATASIASSAAKMPRPWLLINARQEI